MRRRIIIAVGMMSLAVSLLCAVQGQMNTALWLALNGMALGLSIAFSHWQRAEGLRAMPDRHFVSTGERFLDPHSETLIEVLLNPRTGERHYVNLGR